MGRAFHLANPAGGLMQAERADEPLIVGQSARAAALRVLQ